MPYDTIEIRQRGAITIVTLNRPDALNALSTQVEADLVSAFEAFAGDDTQRCAIVTGSERAFAAGGDIREMQAKGFTEMFGGDFFAGFNRVAAVRKPWIAAVAGYALGGGCELAMMADFIIAADNAKFGQPEIRLAVAPGMGGTQRLARAIGKAKAMDMCLTGRLMDAFEAERSGLVARVVDPATLLEEALSAADAIAAMAPLAVMANKEMVNVAFETHLAQGLAFERRLMHGLFATRDKAEGMAAFAEKRVPEWSGK